MRICPSRKSTHSIMNNRGYGNVSLIRNGIEYKFEKSDLFNDGKIKKYALEKAYRYFEQMERQAV